MIQPEKDHSEPTNPFRPGMGLDPPYLADRAAELDRFDKYLAGFPTFPRNVRLTGLRGVGKTRTTLRKHRVLRAVATGGEITSLQSVRERLSLPNRRMQPLIAGLEVKGLLYRPERGRLAFTVPLFGDYLRRKG